MLAMWHRVLTQPVYCFGPASRFRDTFIPCVRRCTTHIDISNIVQWYVEQERGRIEFADLGAAMPISDLCWVEYLNEGVQVGACFMKSPEDEHVWAMCVCMTNDKGQPIVCGGGPFMTNATGQVIGILDEAVEPSLCSSVLVHCASAFAFAHCKNVELIDCTKEHGPDSKFCRRKRVPSVVYKTLKIPGMTSHYVRGDGHSGVEMRSHICRGHFATYTADKPLFGRPDGIGKFWHPAHVRGNARHGAVVKDYEIGELAGSK